MYNMLVSPHFMTRRRVPMVGHEIAVFFVSLSLVDDLPKDYRQFVVAVVITKAPPTRTEHHYEHSSRPLVNVNGPRRGALCHDSMDPPTSTMLDNYRR